jgi:glycosyltransferase involved in cell wall biosynthesis
MFNHPLLLLADGRIATTALVERLLRATGASVTMVASEEILGQSATSQHLVVSRLCHPRLSWLPDFFCEHSIPYVYFLDDNFYELSPSADPYNGKFFSHPAVHASLDNFLLNASVVWVMSEPLQQYLWERHPTLNIEHVHGPVDIPLFDANRPTLHGDANQPIRVGYPTTRKLNVSTLLNEIVRSCAAKFVFEFVGWCPDEIADHKNVTLFPAISDYSEFVAFSQSRRWDIGLAPLGDSAFENAKTNVKYREYAAAKIPAIYSDVPLFRSCIDNGVTGLLAANKATAWIEAIARLVESNALRKNIAAAARADVEEKYAQDVVAVRVAGLLTRALIS